MSVPGMHSWTLMRLVGEGSYGRVFEAGYRRSETAAITSRAAIKIIQLPQNLSEIKSARADGMSDKDIKAYYDGFVRELIHEIELMSRLKGAPSIVKYEAHTVIEHESGIGWDIIIRMEYLKSLLDHVTENPFTFRDIIKLGIDICQALEACSTYNIVHRDVKLENIFISNSGDFKLGDFGIARTIEKGSSSLSRNIGTPSYMAPEVYYGNTYGQNVDIYSLGIILYRLFNDNRMPFLPMHPAPITRKDREEAFLRRIRGEKIERPRNAKGRLAHIILKACAYKPENRYTTAKQMRQELQSLSFRTSESEPKQFSKPTQEKAADPIAEQQKNKPIRKKANKAKNAITEKVKTLPEVPLIWKKIALYSSAVAAILMTIITSTWLALQIGSIGNEQNLEEFIIDQPIEPLPSPPPITSSIDPPINFPGPATWPDNVPITINLHGISSADIYEEPGTITGNIIETIWGNAVLHYLYQFEIDANNDAIYWLKVRSHSGTEGYVRSTLLEAVIHGTEESTKNIVFDSLGSGWFRKYNNEKRVVHVEYNAYRVIDWHQVYDEYGNSIEEITYMPDGSFSQQIR